MRTKLGPQNLRKTSTIPVYSAHPLFGSQILPEINSLKTAWRF